MGRPPFEKETDLENERRAAKRMVEASREPIFFSKLRAGLWCVDWAIFYEDGERLLGFAEYKRRHIDFGQYDDFRVCAKKWLMLRELAQHGEHRKSLFILETNGGLLHRLIIRPQDEVPRIVHWGRRNERDDYDVAPSVAIPWSKFKPIGESNE